VKQLTVNQPRSITLLGYFQSSFWTFALGLFFFLLWPPRDNLRPQDLPLLGIILFFNVIAWTQLLLRIRTLTVTPGGVTVRYFLGRTAHHEWEALQEVRLMDAVPGKGSTQILWLVPRKGLKLKIDDRMSNFDELVNVLQGRQYSRE
jgi:hypothetical protein